MGSKVEYVEAHQMYATNYVRNSKAIGVLWGIFSICYAIISVVALVTPEWIGDTGYTYGGTLQLQTQQPGRFGLWTYCSFSSGKSSVSAGLVEEEECKGSISDVISSSTSSSDVSPLPAAFRAATILVAVSVLLSLITLVAFLLFFFISPPSVFRSCAWMQLLSGLCMVAGVASYPAGWDWAPVRATCGPSAGLYRLGDGFGGSTLGSGNGGCGVRWAFVLAAVAAADSLVLAALAFLLASRHVRLLSTGDSLSNVHNNGLAPGSLYKGEVNGAFVSDAQSLAGSRKSLNLRPVMLMPPPPGSVVGGSGVMMAGPPILLHEQDRYSEFSSRTAGGRSKSSAYRGDYASSMHNYQL
ncbi:LHFPL tetraspan subfamily member 3 protein isoform X2 [Ischnura elegans]|uniref:LHFPL tetraspan subfamily member 3 protein isoform X2 n=1 Tax=Ischnura elegans TaxID=197161 RepID=UPI001ED89609|nr:LHFPL tetraspan subfamily member 3 protein isoform X2 [Ischnura elegans]